MASQVAMAQQGDYTVTVTAQLSSSDLQQQIGEENLGKVESLTLKGTINSYDFMILRNKMPNLQNLDMTDVSIVANSYEYYTGCHSEDNVLGENLFRRVPNLVTVVLPKSITRMGDNVFRECTGLKSIEAYEGLEEIGKGAFCDCGNLQDVKLKTGLKMIKSDTFNQAFGNCKSLESIVLPEGLEAITDNMFSACRNLASVTLPSTIEKIESHAFMYCALRNINLPPNVKTIETLAFRFCQSLAEIHLPSSLQSIGDNAFESCDNLNDIYAYTLEPTPIGQNTFATWSTATLHIPTLSYYNYYWDTQWSQFAHLVMDHDYTYEYFYIAKDFIFNDQNASLGSTPDVDLTAGSGLIVEAENATVGLNNVNLTDNGTYAASIVANGNLTMNHLNLQLEMAANKWYFLSVPFRVKRSGISAPGDFALRYYDGQERATNGKGGWKDYEGDYLVPGQGYIVQTNTAGKLQLPVEQTDMDFSGIDRTVALTAYAASNKQNASWNYVGNPHAAYFDISQMEYTAPLTVWNGTTYTAVRPGDDSYHIGPMQGFFVQKPEGVDAIVFPAAGRHTYRQWMESSESRQARRALTGERSLIDLALLEDRQQQDQTRVVFNADKSADYELDCDAAKFIASGVSQLYTLDAQNCYAINERPMGEVKVGYVSAATGELTIEATRMDMPICYMTH